MKINLIIISILFLSLALQGQESYSKTFDLGAKRSEVVWNLNIRQQNLYASIGANCDSAFCTLSAQINPEDGEFIWSDLLPWLEYNSNEIAEIGNRLYFVGSNKERDSSDVYASSLQGDSILKKSYPLPDSLVFFKTGGVTSYNNEVVLFGSGLDTILTKDVCLVYWINLNGNIDTIMKFAPANFSQLFFQGQVDQNNDLYLFMRFNNLNPTNNQRYQILKFNTNRELIWQWESPASMRLAGDMPPRFLVHSNGNIYMTADPRPDAFDGVWVLKPNGDLEFKAMSDVFNNRYGIARLKEADDGGILACGYLDGYNLPEGSLAHIFKMDEDGDLLWERIIAENKNEEFGIPNALILADLVELENGDLLFGGRQAVWHYDDNNEVLRQNDAWLLRTNSEGCVLEDCGYIQDLLSSRTELKTPSPFKISPNPTSGFVHLEYPNELTLQAIEVYDNIGQKLGKLHPQSSNELDLSRFSSGLLYLKITTDDGRVWTERVVKE